MYQKLGDLNFQHSITFLYISSAPKGLKGLERRFENVVDCSVEVFRLERHFCPYYSKTKF